MFCPARVASDEKLRPILHVGEYGVLSWRARCGILLVCTRNPVSLGVKELACTPSEEALAAVERDESLALLLALLLALGRCPPSDQKAEQDPPKGIHHLPNSALPRDHGHAPTTL